MARSASGSIANKSNEFTSIVERCYDTHLADSKGFNSSADFYRAVCETVEEINKKLGSTQFNVPKTTTLKLVFDKHLSALKNVTDEATREVTGEATPGQLISKETFEEIVQEVIVESGFSAGFGAKDILAYIFGIPMTALVIKQRFAPKTIPNDLFIPAITSATVFVLAKLRKI